MRIAPVVVTASLVLASLTACTQPPDEKVGEKIVALQDTVLSLKRQLSLLKDEADIDRDKLGNLQTEVTPEKWATGNFDPTDSTYQRVDSTSGIGSFAVQVRDFRPFGDGVRVTLTLGNLTAAIINGATLDMKYGSRPPAAPPFPNADYMQQYAAWQGTLKAHEQSVLATLRPGAWNPVTITLPGIDPKNFGFLGVTISTSQISLYR